MKTIRWLIIPVMVLFLCTCQGLADINVKVVKSETGQKAVTTVSDECAPDELLVRFTVPQSDSKIAGKMERVYGKALKRLDKIENNYSAQGLSNTYRIRLTPGENPKEAREKYRKDPEVMWAEPNYKVSIDLLPGDPSFPQLWGLHNTGQTGGTADADIDAPEAWDLSTGSAEVVVAVVDTGVDYNHPDLAANIWVNSDEVAGNGIDDDHNGYIDDVRGWDFYNKDNNPMDDNNHGTHCAGTIGAVGSNGMGVSGVMWNVRIMPLKFMSSGGSGYVSDAVAAILYANQNGAHVVSNSWGGGGYSQALKDAIDASPAVVVCAAGNSGKNIDSSPFYPASYTSSNLISVAATDSKDARASFSNYGANSVDVAAPGVSIYSTLKGGSYGSMSGTSMSTPHVAGLAGLLKAKNPGLTKTEVKTILLSQCDVLPSLQGKVLTSGRINAGKALSSIQPAGLSIQSVSPATGFVGSLVGVTLTGTGFNPTPVVKLVRTGGGEVTGFGVSVVSSTRITCTFDLSGAPPGAYDVRVIQNGETVTLPAAFVVQTTPTPVPFISALSPSSATAGGSGFVLTVSGSNFTNSGVVNWNGAARSTTFISASQLQAAISASDISSQGTASVTVTDPGRGTSNDKTFTILAPAPPPVPVITSLSPSSATAGGSGFVLTVSGSNFTSASVVNWNGDSRSTTFSSSAQLQAAISASDITSQGTASVTVTDPGRGTSNGKAFTITSLPAPTVSSVSPSSVRRGTTRTLTVSGKYFVSGASVELRKTNYAPIACTNEAASSSTRISCTVAVPSSASRGYWDVVVINPDGKTGTRSRGINIY
jgi:subtilisin family serine protease